MAETPEWMPDRMGYGRFTVDSDGDFECAPCHKDGRYWSVSPKGFTALEDVLTHLYDHTVDRHL